MLDAEHLRAKADECRTRAKIETDSILREALMSLADYYEKMATELSSGGAIPITDRRSA